MSQAALRDALESRQVALYVAALLAGALAAMLAPGMVALERTLEAALAAMLFATFLNVPLADLGRALREARFVAALLVSNFVAVPLLVALLVQMLPPDPLLRFGVSIVLLCPCIDYVVTFAHMGRADARALLAATPLLLALQMLLLPLYLRLLLPEAAALVEAGPFLRAFLVLIVAPLALAALCQAAARRFPAAGRIAGGVGLLAVPATALVLFVVACSVMPRLDAARDSALAAAPAYLVFAGVAPLLGLAVGRLFGLGAASRRTLAFSSATRNSLVVLPLGLALPDAIPVLPAVIVTQTMIELVAELLYLRLLPRVGGPD